MTIQRILLVILLFTTAKAYSQPISDVKKEALSNTLYPYTSEGSPGIAVGIIKDGNIAYEYYAGYANLEHKVNIDQDTRFNIASNAKQFTALCILKLMEEGRISLEDDIRKYLPDFYKNIEDKITISDLLAHTSGIRDAYDLWALKGQTWWKLFIDNSDAIELLKSQVTLNFKPGTEYLYSNSNYILLTEIIKNVSGKNFSDFAKSMFLELEMPDTEFLINYMAVVPNKARPYGNWNGWREYPSITETHGDGALFTTLRDQLQWEQIIQVKEGNHLSKKLIDESQLLLANSYGYGLMFDNYKGLNYTYHDGNTGAYNATFMRFTDQNLSILLISNNGNIPTHYLAKQLVDIVLDLDNSHTDYPAMPDKVEHPEQMRAVLGNYKNADGTIIRITEKEGSIFREIYQREPVKLISESGGLFHYETNRDLKMNFTQIGKSEQQFTIYLSSQAPATYYKLHDSALDHFDKEELNGTFYNKETDTEIEIMFLDNNKYSLTKNGRERKAELVIKDFLRMNSYEIKVIRDQKGSSIGLNIKNNRIKNVIFKRTQGKAGR